MTGLLWGLWQRFTLFRQVASKLNGRPALYSRRAFFLAPLHAIARELHVF
nr:MAG TPA: hypothetical protein [Caudoviricetes sp.]